jgi:hypothetical protein
MNHRDVAAMQGGSGAPETTPSVPSRLKTSNFDFPASAASVQEQWSHFRNRSGEMGAGNPIATRKLHSSLHAESYLAEDMRRSGSSSSESESQAREQNGEVNAAYTIKKNLPTSKEAQPKTISPKDAILDYRNDEWFALFPEDDATSADRLSNQPVSETMHPPQQYDRLPDQKPQKQDDLPPFSYRSWYPPDTENRTYGRSDSFTKLPPLNSTPLPMPRPLRPPYQGIKAHDPPHVPLPQQNRVPQPVQLPPGMTPSTRDFSPSDSNERMRRDYNVQQASAFEPRNQALNPSVSMPAQEEVQWNPQRIFE